VPASGDALRDGLTFPLQEDEFQLRDELEAFVQKEVMSLPDEHWEGDQPHPEMISAIRAAGLYKHVVPVDYGGSGLSVTKVCLIREHLSYAAVQADEAFISQAIAVQPIVLHGTHEQKGEHLDGLLTGKRTFAFCLTEPSAGSDVSGIRTSARETPDGYVLNGTKRYVFQGGSVNTLLVFAKLGDPDVRGPITGFLFDRPEKGYTARPFPLLFQGPEFEVDLEDLHVPASAMLGPPDKGARVALGNFDRLRPSVGAAAVGMAQRALDTAVAYVKERQAFGQRLADFQGLQFRLADAAVELGAARVMVYAAARHADTAPEGADVRSPSAAAKLFATEMAQRVIDTSIQVHGGIGLRRGSITERLYKAVRATRIYEGSSDIMKVVIARSLVGADRRERPR